MVCTTPVNHFSAAEAAKNPYYPLQTAHGLHLFTLMRSTKPSYNLRQSVGRYLAKAGFLAKGEFKAAEAALRSWPDAPFSARLEMSLILVSFPGVLQVGNSS